MSDIATDTHSLLWYLAKSPRLSVAAFEAFQQAARNGSRIYVPTICLVEITYLSEKSKLPMGTRDWVLEAIDSRPTPYTLAPLDRAVSDALAQIPRTIVPDMPDRIISATAFALGVPLVSADQQIHSSQVETIW